MSDNYQKKPEWLKISLKATQEYSDVKKTITKNKLSTVCTEARCPNLNECWGKHKTAAFMVLGDTCTRRCRFCSVKTGMPEAVDWQEAERVAESVKSLNLKHTVITMVNRDDLKDGGSAFMAEVIRKVREINDKCTIEILSSDMMGKEESIALMMDEKLEIMSHNIETVKRLTSHVRSNSKYERFLFFLKNAAAYKTSLIKSSLMLGLGETVDELYQTFDDLLDNGVEILNLGQYLQPAKSNILVQKYWTPEEFTDLKEAALERGFKHCESGPLVRSSYHAGEQLAEIIGMRCTGMRI